MNIKTKIKLIHLKNIFDTLMLDLFNGIVFLNVILQIILNNLGNVSEITKITQ